MSPQKPFDRHIRVFLSSTFRDMSQERDYLLKYIFPEVKQVSRQRQVELSAIDLRWGVTEEEAKQGKVVRICLEEIDRCKPFFIGLLGERYGWSPQREDLAHYQELMDNFPFIEASMKAGKSVTEMEIIHGVLEAKDPSSLEAIFFHRSPELTKKLAQQSGQLNDYYEFDQQAQKKLVHLKERIRQHPVPHFFYEDMKELGQQVKKQLLALLDRLYPENHQLSELDQERLRHRTFAQSKCFQYLPSSELIFQLNHYLSLADFDEHGQRTPPLVISGESGLGKSALLSYWLTTSLETHPKLSYIEYYPGASHSTTERDILLRLYREAEARLSQAQKKAIAPKTEFPKRIVDLRELVLNALTDIVNKSPLLILIDALNQVEMRDLTWLPIALPAGIKLILSVTPGELSKQLSKRHYKFIHLKPLSIVEKKNLVENYLGFYRKKLSPQQLKKLVSAKQCENPLFLTTVLNELLLFGHYEYLDQLIDHCVAKESLMALFEFVLERLESDYGQDLTSVVLRYLWAARHGLSEDELMELSQKNRLDLSPLLIALNHHLISKNGLYSFSHNYLKIAISNKYLPHLESQYKYHTLSAQWLKNQPLNDRKRDELPWQWQQAKQPKQLKDCLCDLELFQAIWEHNQYETIAYWAYLEKHFDPEEIYIDLLYSLKIKFKEAAAKYAILDHSNTDFITEKETFSHRFKQIEALSHFIKLLGRPKRLVPILYWLYQGTKCFYANDWVTVNEHRLHLAECYRDTFQFTEAISLTKEAINKCMKLGGAHHPSTLDSANNLGVLYLTQGELKEATHLLNQTFETRLTVLGIEHPDTLISYSNFIEALRVGGSLQQAKQLTQGCHHALLQILGSEHPLCLIVYIQLGEVLFLNEEYERAETVLRHALELCQKKLGHSHQRSLQAQSDVIELLIKFERYEEAEPLLHELYDTRKEVLGIDHPQTVVSAEQLGKIFYQAKSYDEAEEIFRLNLQQYQKELGSDHYHTVRAKNNLAYTLLSKNQAKQAEKLFKEVLKAAVEKLGYQHKDTVIYAKNLASLLCEQEHYQEAQEYLEPALQHSIVAFGVDHDITVLLADYSWECYEALEQYKAAETIFDDLLKLLKSSREVDRLKVAQILCKLSEIKKYLDKTEESLSFYQEAYDVYLHVLGPEHSDTLETGFYYAQILTACGHFNEAETVFKQVIAGENKLYGVNSIEAHTTHGELGITLMLQEKYQEAEEHLRISLSDSHSDEVDDQTPLQGWLAWALFHQQNFVDAQYLFEQIIDQALVQNNDPEELTMVGLELCISFLDDDNVAILTRIQTLETDLGEEDPITIRTKVLYQHVQALKEL